MPRPLVAVACAFAAGSAVGGGLPLTASASLMALTAAVLVAATSAVSRRAAAILAAALALGAAAAAGEGRAYDRAPLREWILDRPDEGPVKVRGVCRGDPREAED